MTLADDGHDLDCELGTFTSCRCILRWRAQECLCYGADGVTDPKCPACVAVG